MIKRLHFLVISATGVLLLLMPIAWKVTTHLDSKVSVRAIDQFCQTFGDEVLHKHGWHMRYFEQTFDKNLHGLAFSFWTSETMDVDQARDGVMQLCDELLAAVNASPKLRPYLAHYPFTPQDIWMSLYPKGNMTNNIYFGECCCLRGRLCFANHDDSGEYRRGWEILDESWEEGMARREAWRSAQSVH